MNKKTISSSILCFLAAIFVLSICITTIVGCASQEIENSTHINISSLKGPTSIGIAKMLEESEDKYNVEMCTSADLIAPKLANGSTDIALIPANIASSIYSKTNGAIKVIDINTKGVLYGISYDENTKNIQDLKGKKVYMTGSASIPQYTLDALLDAYSMCESDINIEFKSEPAEVISALSANREAFAILPQPYVAAACAKDNELHINISLSDEWDKTYYNEGSLCVTGVTVVRTDFLENHPDAVKQFLNDHSSSIDFVTNNTNKTAEIIVNAGIINNTEIAEKSIDACNVVCITGEEMKTALGNYLWKMQEFNAELIGGTMPDDDFYYLG